MRTAFRAIPLLSATRLDALYAELPTLQCQQKCQESCGPVFMSRLEWERICSRLGEERQGTADLRCPMLKDGGCEVYSTRPAICRLWGLVEKMRCPWGCVPERFLTDEEAHAWLERVVGAGC